MIRYQILFDKRRNKKNICLSLTVVIFLQNPDEYTLADFKPEFVRVQTLCKGEVFVSLNIIVHIWCEAFITCNDQKGDNFDACVNNWECKDKAFAILDYFSSNILSGLNISEKSTWQARFLFDPD